MRNTARSSCSLFIVLAALAACDPYQPCKPEENADSDGYTATPCLMQTDWKDKGYEGEWFCDPSSADGGQGTTICTQHCSTHADCKPAADEDVSAVPRCDAGVCVLGCRPGWTCPEGTGCEPNDLASVKATGYWGRCSQVYSDELPPARPEDLASPGQLASQTTTPTTSHGKIAAPRAIPVAKSL